MNLSSFSFQPLRSGRQSTESVGSSSPTKAIGTGTRRHPVAPFPGPSSSTEHVDQVGGESILSPADSVFSSQSSTNSIISGGEHDHDYRSHDQDNKSHDMNPILEYDGGPFEVDVEITGCDDEETDRGSEGRSINGGNANEQLSNSRSEKGERGVGKTQEKELEDERVGSPQDVAKIEAFHNSVAYHFSTILLSDNATEVVSSAQ